MSDKSEKELLCPDIQPKSLRIGTIKKGIDNNLWIIESKNKVKIWVKYTNHTIINYKSLHNDRSNKLSETNSYVSKESIRSTTKYKQHNNGDRPFLTIIKPNEIIVFGDNQEYKDFDNFEYRNLNYINIKYRNIDFNYVNYDENKIVYDIPILTIKNFLGYWKGYDPNNSEYEGNSLLIQLDSYNYISIGQHIYSFSTTDIIYDYYSEVRNNDVPYPFALGEKNTYFTLEMEYLKNEEIPNTINKNDYYGYYYDHVAGNNIVIKGNQKKKDKKDRNPKAQKILNYIILQKRL
jgi:hypothetical protein